MWTRGIAVLFCVTTVTLDTVLAEDYEHSLVVSAFTTNILSNQSKHIYLLNGEPADIYRQHVAEERIQTFTLTFGNPLVRILSIGVNYAKRKLYIQDVASSSIACVDKFNWQNAFAGMSIKTIHAGLSKSVYTKIAVDWVSDVLYWVDPVFRWIAVQSGNIQNIDQSNFNILVYNNLQHPTALAVDPVRGFMFWSDVGDVVKIERSHLNAEGRTSIVSTGLAFPSAIDIDQSSLLIYWVDHDRDTIEEADFDGNNRRTVRRMAHSEFIDIVVLGSIITVSDFTTGTLHLVNKHTGEIFVQGLDIKSIITVSDYSTGTLHLINKHTGEIYVQGLKNTVGDKFWALGLYTPHSQPSGTDKCPSKSCSDICVNGPSDAECLCREGYQLNADNRTCTEVAGEYHRAIVVAGPQFICMKDIRGVASAVHQTKSNCVVNVTGDEIRYFDLDMINRKIFYATATAVFSKMIGGTDLPVQVVSVTDDITGLSLNWRDRNIYWSMGEGSGKIQLFSQTTRSTYTILESDLYNPRDLVLLPLDRLMVWISGSTNNYKIETAYMDGTDRQTIVKPANLGKPLSLAADHATNTIYWTDLATIFKSNLDGTGLFRFKTDTLSTQLVTVYKNYLIFTEDKFDGSHVVGGSASKEKIGTLQDFRVPEVGTAKCIKVLDSHLQPTKKGPCAVLNGNCEHICLPIGETKICKCEYGFTLDSNRQTCSSTPPEDNFLVVTDWTHDKIYHASLDNDVVLGLDTNQVSSPTGIGLNHKTKQIVWGDSDQKIHRISLNGSHYRILKSIENLGSHPDRFAIDHSTDNIYYTAVPVQVGGFVGVGVISPDGKHRQLIRYGERPRDIVLDPAEGYLFWSDHSMTPFVRKANMDGTSGTNIITSDIVWPNGLAIDEQANQLYVTDGALNTIQRCTYGGICTEIYKSENAHFMDVGLLGNYLYFTAWNKQYITKLNKDDTTDIDILARKSELGRLDALDLFRSSEIAYTESALCSQQNGGCSTFCFPTPGGKVCGCEDGISLKSDGTTCTNIITTTTTTPITTTTTSIPITNEKQPVTEGPPYAVIGGAVAGGVILIIILILLIYCLGFRNRQTNKHTSFANPVADAYYNPYIEPTPGPSEICENDERESGVYIDIDDVNLRAKLGESLKEDDVRKSTNLYVTLQPSPAVQKREGSHEYITAQRREGSHEYMTSIRGSPRGSPRVQNDYQTHSQRQTSDQYMQPSFDLGQASGLRPSYNNPSYSHDFDKDEDRMSPKLSRKPMTDHQSGSDFLQVPKDPLRQSVDSLDHLQDYMIPAPSLRRVLPQD